MACARNAPAELHHEDERGALTTARVRLLVLEDEQILTDRPISLDGEARIPIDAPITVHLSIDGVRYRFDSAIDRGRCPVPLNRHQSVSGISLRKPASLTESQRRANLRISMVGYDPISADMVRPCSDVPDACPIDAELIAGWLIDLSVGGALILVDQQRLDSAARGDRFFITFRLPSVAEPFHLLGSVRHIRLVEFSESLRLGISFRPWCGVRLRLDQRRLSRFVARHERHMLRRRR